MLSLPKIPKVEAEEERNRETPYWALERGATTTTKDLGILGGEIWFGQ